MLVVPIPCVEWKSTEDIGISYLLVVKLRSSERVAVRSLASEFRIGVGRLQRILAQTGLEIQNGKLVDVQGWVTGEEAKTTPSPKPKTAKPRTSPKKIPADVVERRFQQYMEIYRPLGESENFKSWTKVCKDKVRRLLANPKFTANQEWDRFIAVTRKYLETVTPKYQRLPYYHISKSNTETWLEEEAKQKSPSKTASVFDIPKCPDCGVAPCTGWPNCPKHKEKYREP